MKSLLAVTAFVAFAICLLSLSETNAEPAHDWLVSLVMPTGHGHGRRVRRDASQMAADMETLTCLGQQCIEPFTPLIGLSKEQMKTKIFKFIREFPNTRQGLQPVCDGYNQFRTCMDDSCTTSERMEALINFTSIIGHICNRHLDEFITHGPCIHKVMGERGSGECKELGKAIKDAFNKEVARQSRRRRSADAFEEASRALAALPAITCQELNVIEDECLKDEVKDECGEEASKLAVDLYQKFIKDLIHFAKTFQPSFNAPDPGTCFEGEQDSFFWFF